MSLRCSAKSKVLLFFWVWSLNMHAPYFCPLTIWAISLEFRRKPYILEAEDFLGACYRKAMTPKMLWTLLFLQMGTVEIGRWMWHKRWKKASLSLTERSATFSWRCLQRCERASIATIGSLAAVPADGGVSPPRITQEKATSSFNT